MTALTGDTAALFAALGDETRLALAMRLAEGGPESAARLGAGWAVSRQAIAKHLEVLAAAGLVQGHRFGRERLWELQPLRLSEASEQLTRMARLWDGAPGRVQGPAQD